MWQPSAEEAVTLQFKVGNQPAHTDPDYFLRRNYLMWRNGLRKTLDSHHQVLQWSHRIMQYKNLEGLHKDR